MDLLSVQSLLQQGMFKIPSYQRGYSWQHKQVGDFIEDLQEALELREHYTGTVTVVEKDVRKVFPKTFKLYDVVDGQQRLTTFTIFIHCIHNRLKSLKVDDDSLSDILKNIIYKHQTILELHSDVHEFYHDYIVDKSIREIPTKLKNKSQQNLANAKKQISRFLDGFSSLDEIQELYSTLMNKFKVNFYSLSKESDVGVVFETMNNRGLPLTKMDMVKNYLVYLAARLEDEKLAEKINVYFGEVYDSLMSIEASPTEEDDVLRYSYIIYTGIKVDDIYTDIKSFLRKDSKKEDILSYVIFLRDSAVIYAKIRSGDFKDANVKSLIKKILWLGTHSNFLPLLIILIKKHKELELVNTLKLIEVYSFRVYKIANKRDTAGRNILHKASHQLFKNNLDLAILKQELTDSINQHSDNHSFKVALEVKNFFTQQDTTEISYFFYEYEVHLHEQKISVMSLIDFDTFKQDVSGKKLTVEHIEPQDPQSRFPLESVHKLGNLTITYDNSILSNKEFHSKKAFYKKSKLLVENDISVNSRWTEQEINIRTKELVKFASQRWKI